MSEERWLPVVGFEGLYEVSDFGRVRSLDRLATYTTPKGTVVIRRHKGVLLKPGIASNGYPLVVLGKGNSRLVHALVLTAFVGPPAPGFEVCHADGTRTNNCLTNLRWGTRTDNMRDAVRHGTANGYSSPGSTNGSSVLTEGDIPLIRQLVRSGLRYTEIAPRFGVGPDTIGLIARGRTWSHVP
jgi:hypothetical protein